MGVTSKWWLGMTLAMIFIGFLCSSAEASTVIANTTSMEKLLGANPSLGIIQQLYDWIYVHLFWNYSVLTQTSLGQMFRMVMFCFTMAVMIPVIHAAIALGKPFGGS